MILILFPPGINPLSIASWTPAPLLTLSPSNNSLRISADVTSSLRPRVFSIVLFISGLFSSYIIRVSNPDDAYLVDIYGTPEKGIVASYKTMYELLEYEHNLWEY